MKKLTPEQQFNYDKMVSEMLEETNSILFGDTRKRKDYMRRFRIWLAKKIAGRGDYIYK